MRLTVLRAGAFAIFALGWVFSGSASAAECEDGLAVYGQDICEDAAVNIPYSQMQAAYSKLALSGGDDFENLLARDQKKWLNFMRRACVAPADGSRPDYKGEQPYCISDLLVSRTIWLEYPWKIRGVQFSPLGVYGTKVDTINTIGPPVGKYEFSIMLMDETGELGVEYNKYARAGYGLGALQPLIEMSEMNGEVDSQTFVRIHEVTPERISNVVESILYYHGAAHGSSYLTYEHYLVGEKRGLVAGDIFSGENWQQELQEIVTKAILTDGALREVVWDDFSDALPMTLEPDRWKFTPEGLEVQFQQYELTAYAYGAPSVVLPWKELAGLLAPGALRIAGVS